MTIHIRPVIPDDAAAYRALRLKAVADHPDAFGRSLQEEEARSVAFYMRRIHENAAEGFTLGAWDGERLCGMVVLHPEQILKRRHIAFIFSVYVLPDYRKQGIARNLMQETIRRAREIDRLEMLLLDVGAHNVGAVRLYESMGFKTYGKQPHAFKLEDGRYVDELHMLLDITS